MPGDFFTDEPLVTSCKLGNQEEIELVTLLETGATGHAFIDEKMVRTICERLQLSPQRLTKPKPVRGFDGRLGKPITHAIYPTLTVQNHRETISPLLITQLGQHKMILGKPWMRKHGVILDMSCDKIMFWPGHCTHPGAPKLIELPRKLETINKKSMDEELTTVISPQKILRRSIMEDKPEATPIPKEVPRIDPKPSKPVDVAIIGAESYRYLTHCKAVKVYAISMKDIDDQLNKESRPPTDPKLVVPPEYHEFLDVFSKIDSDTLSPHRLHDHKILLEGGKDHGYSPLRSMSQKELEFVRKYLEDNLRKGFIEASHAACSSPILLAKKPSGGLRFCVDYRRLNQVTKNDRYPITFIEETLA